MKNSTGPDQIFTRAFGKNADQCTMFTSNLHIRRSPALPNNRHASQRRNWSENHRKVQWKYTFFLIAAIFGTVSLFLGASFFLLRQNYSIFKTLAYDTNPEMISHLERELTEYGLFMLATLSSVFIFCLVLGLRITGNMIRPVIQLEKHMRKVTQGDWASKEFRFRENEDLIDLLDTYSYMYRSLRAHTEAELKMLEKMTVDSTNRESVGIWKSLIMQKRAQLNISLETGMPKETDVSETSEETLKPPGIPRAS